MRPALIAFAMLLYGVSSTTAYAQNDHYHCYKAKDSVKIFTSAAADLTPLQLAEFGAENCEIKPRSKQVCAPASKSVTDIVSGTDTPFTAQALTDFQICYKIRCPKVALSPVEVSDQFGTRDIEKFKAKKLCVPAELVPLP